VPVAGVELVERQPGFDAPLIPVAHGLGLAIDIDFAITSRNESVARAE
jgi:hypothetical protein